MLRLSRAQQLLRETSRSILEVGVATGFGSPSQFCKAFRRSLGMTPSAARQQDWGGDPQCADHYRSALPYGVETRLG
jgi:transcriptional regulator GlxA family with amidase domain